MTTSCVQSLGSNRNKLLKPEMLGHELTPPKTGRIAVKIKGQMAKCLMSSPPMVPQPKGHTPTASRLGNLREVGRALHHNLSKDQNNVARSFNFAAEARQTTQLNQHLGRETSAKAGLAKL